MKRFVALFYCLFIFQLAIAASPRDQPVLPYKSPEESPRPQWSNFQGGQGMFFLGLDQFATMKMLQKQDQERIFASKESADSPIASSNTRSFLDFGLMIWCGVNRNPLDYNGYGCYCGIGGHGTPVDDTDRCCQIHDACYSTVQNSGSCPFDWAIYVIPYSRKDCYGCEPADYYWFYGKCRSSLCECDSQAVQCFRRSKFSDSYKHYSRDKC